MARRPTASSHQSKPSDTSPARGGRRRGLFRALLGLVGLALLGSLIVGVVALGSYMLHLDGVIRAQFEGKRWALPARVYARPLELFPGAPLAAEQLAKELERLNYRPANTLQRPGSFIRKGDSFDIYTRSFTFWDGPEPSQRVRVSFAKGSVQALQGLDGQGDPGLMRMEPQEIAAIYPSHYEDRILVKREELPPVLVDALIAVEDRKFYEHFGVDPKGVVRAIWANFQAGRTVQGASTLTQQLVKNYFLSSERSLTRKVNEMLMAILLEWHYDKDQILEAYANEIYLGQDGSRAIHGFGLASRFYFGRPLSELSLHHMALLVGLAKGASAYDPRRHPERALERRNLVLDVMAEQNLISREDAEIAKKLPLDVLAEAPSGITRYPAFVDLVQRQLRQFYKEEDLTSEGLKIFTTLDPLVQEAAEQAISDELPKLEKEKKLPANILQSAALVADTQTGEVQALVGGRDVRLAGFNRALDAVRQTGSLIKPPIYLTALEYPQRYTLATVLDDASPVVYTSDTGQRWSPGNYDKRYHGYVMLRDALAKSYNIPTVRIGLDLDVIQVISTLKRLGLNKDLKPFPSLLLGAVDVTLIEVAQIYETFASGGFRVPLRAIREVTTAEGQPLSRYPLSAVKVIEPGPAFLINKALQQVALSGTATAIYKTLPKDLGVAGKTGTTDDYRDSWFAGFTGNRLAVVWVGRDDNKPTKLSGGAGALPVWIRLMAKLPLEPLELQPPPDIEMAAIDPANGLRADHCPGAVTLPFLAGSAPTAPSPCGGGYADNQPAYEEPVYGGGYEAA
ncbi:MAG TPA: penicillin-binding protein 1B, partial [Candidatus Competibacteraceae bacterium]|nr:penicillin-binding protein 1B [Candidatus Competibacteraceae bacterium]